MDSIRAVAVALVIFYHFGFAGVPGGHGVLLFFVLSGFLITWLLLNEEDAAGDVSLKGFYVRRALRILPAFFVFFFVALSLLLVTGRQVFWPQAVSTFFYLANYYGALHPEAQCNGVFNHIWSLAVEEQFYLLWPCMFVLLRKNKRRLTWALGGTILAVWIYRATLVYVGVPDRYIYHAFDTRIDHLLIGCFTAVVLKRGAFPAFWGAITRRAWMPAVTALLFAGSAIYGMTHVGYRDAIGYAVDPTLAAVGIVQLVALGDTAPWRWLDSAFTSWMGRISYSLYLYQQMGVSKYVLPGRALPVRLAACLLVTFALAAASHYVVEKPFLRLKDRKQRASEGAPAAEAADRIAA